ncbi:MAG: phosphoribosylamine--glycine ligase [Candidatus Thermoplasmatota archaeon]|jgi:phosphoribosylamine--glycine ligase|uniref:phosphoribosylamine--glycine ligase n=1 Tax=Ferroplasma sp. TaxID=2591003 RepID=UPI00260F3CA1|nr:phosphoribosylamine--glycine ligase [Ferroplasma sp.]MCL4312481.1 phosphoribosylamine--glycine ligase [Candidatus Thermoplasmatota archaeon]
MNVLLVGSGGREDAIARKVRETDNLYSVVTNENPSIIGLSRDVIKYKKNSQEIIDFAKKNKIDIAFVSPDDILNTDLVDKLSENHIPVASPGQKAAMIETSKEYMRNLMRKYRIKGDIENTIISDKETLKKFFDNNDSEYAVKPIGLTGGKGVRVMGLQLSNVAEAINYASEIIDRDGKVLMEKREIGEEFSIQAFTDSKTVVFMPVVQDYKRLYEDDLGPNTGGMGSISDKNFILPFLSIDVVNEAREILKHIVKSMREEGNPFRGVIYGQFMNTDHGVRVIEINSRFADPEGINVLTLLKSNIVDIFLDMYSGTLKNNIKFMNKATVLKYIVPPGYGVKPRETELLIKDRIETDNFKIYYSAVSGTLNKVITTKSRALALIGIGDSIYEASDIVEDNLKYITGDYYIRHDIGTEAMMKGKIKD